VKASYADKDLLELGIVIRALGNRGTPATYRNSKLTELLKPVLQPHNWMNVHILGEVSIEKKKEKATRRTFVFLDNARSLSLPSDFGWLYDDN
jgi:hypothetical protein